MKVKPTDNILYTKEGYYESITRKIRWFLILLLVVSAPFFKLNLIPVYTIAGILTVFNITRYLYPFKKLDQLNSKWFIIVVDHLLIVTLIALTGSIASPYFGLSVFMLITSSYWYGSKGIYGIWLSQLAVVSFMQLFSQVAWTELAVKMAINIIAGQLSSWITFTQRSESTSLSVLAQEIERDRAKLQVLINSLGDAVLATDTDGSIILYNGSLLSLLNTHEELAGKPVKEVLGFYFNSQKIDIIDEVIKNNKPMIRDDLSLALGEEVLKVYTNISPVNDKSGRNSGTIILLRDITKSKNLEEQKDEFISVASHELKTPIAIVEANISTALLPSYAKIDDKAKKLLEQAHENVIFLSQLVEDLTTLSRAERGVLEIQMERVDVALLLQELVANLSPKAAKKRLSLLLGDLNNLPKIETSKIRLQEILENLIDNSIKYTQSGSVTVSASPSQKHRGGVTIFVKDTGIGIPKSDQIKIFSKFYRVEDYRTRTTQGTGLGLYIVKKLVERLGGEIGFNSVINKGSSFWVDMPNTSPSQKKEESSKVAPEGRLVGTV